MATVQTQPPIFGAAAQLPRGPHGLSREEVAASQRIRLLAATADVVGERGYGEATIAEISRRAGVSPKTFYEHFDDKLDCYLAAYEEFVMALLERIGTDLDPDAGWHEFIPAMLAGYLGTLEDNPAVARAFLVESDSAGPEARRRRRAAYGRFADLLAARHAEFRALDPTLGPVPDRVFAAIVHGVRELACDALEERVQPRLREIAPDVVLWITATIRGAATASEELALI
jgi:AcrR family transcriptional regulator